jgi:hypothetical protein
MTWLEEYLVRRKLGQRGIEGMGAREVEAFVILEHELAELNGGVSAGRLGGDTARRRKNA